MLNKTMTRRLLGISAAAVMLGAVGAQAQQAPPKTGEANDQTSPNAVERPAPAPMKGAANPSVAPPKVGEANDPTSPNYQHPPAPKQKPMKPSAKKTNPPVTGEANDQTSDAGTTEAAKAAKAARGEKPTK